MKCGRILIYVGQICEKLILNISTNFCLGNPDLLGEDWRGKGSDFIGGSWWLLLAFFQNFGRWQGTMDGTLLFNEYRLSFGVSQTLTCCSHICLNFKLHSLVVAMLKHHSGARLCPHTCFHPGATLWNFRIFFSKGVECNLKECHFEAEKTRFRRGDLASKTTFQFGKECRRKIWEIAKCRVIIGEEITLGLLEFDYNEHPAITNRFLCMEIIDCSVKKSSVTTSTRL